MESWGPPLRVFGLEIDACVHRDCPRSSGARDAAETVGIDVGVRVVPDWPVQHIHRVGANGERLFLGKPDALFQRHVEAQTAWPFKTGHCQSEISRLTRLRVLENGVSRAVENDLIAEAVGHCRVSA